MQDMLQIDFNWDTQVCRIGVSPDFGDPRKIELILMEALAVVWKGNNLTKEQQAEALKKVTKYLKKALADGQAMKVDGKVN